MHKHELQSNKHLSPLPTRATRITRPCTSKPKCEQNSQRPPRSLPGFTLPCFALVCLTLLRFALLRFALLCFFDCKYTKIMEVLHSVKSNERNASEYCSFQNQANKLMRDLLLSTPEKPKEPLRNLKNYEGSCGSTGKTQFSNSNEDNT